MFLLLHEQYNIHNMPKRPWGCTLPVFIHQTRSVWRVRCAAAERGFASRCGCPSGTASLSFIGLEPVHQITLVSTAIAAEPDAASASARRIASRCSVPFS